MTKDQFPNDQSPKPRSRATFPVWRLRLSRPVWSL
jgi:hypothetical protein